MMTEALKDLLPIVVPGLALTAIGANLTWSFGRDLYFGRASRNWREAHGHVVDRDAYSVNVGRGGSLSEAAFTYTYRVNGVEYTSNRYDYAGRNAALGYGSGLPAHSIGERISVWYDPFEPRRAVLVQGVQFGNYLRLLVGAVFLFSGVLLLGTASDVERSDPAMQGRNSSAMHATSDAKKSRVLTSAELESLRRLPSIVDTFIVIPTHIDLRVGDTLRLSSLRMEARDSTGHIVHWDNTTFSIPNTAIIRGIGSGVEAVAPGHASLLIEDRPRDFRTDSLPKRPWTRVDIDVRR